MSHSFVFFPFGMTDITASVQDGGAAAVIRVHFSDSNITGARSPLKIVHH